MKAAVIQDFAEGPRYRSCELPPSGDGVLVDVLAAALSPRVRSGASGQHYTSSGSAVLPLVPGLDGVGRLPDGRRVYFVGHSEKWGTLAEKSLAEPRLMVPIPDGVSAPLLAALMLPAISSWVALTKRVTLQRGQSVLVLGATGTAGRLAVQIAKELGAGHVIAAGRNGDALSRTAADEKVRLTGERADLEALAVASEVDIVLDYLWGTVSSALLPALCRRRQDEARALHWVLIGSMAGDEIALSSVLLRKRNLHILGSGQGASSTHEMFGAAPAIVDAFAAGKLTVDARVVPLAEVQTWWSANLPSGERLVFVP